ncbi:MAG: BBE domain-containing protein [Candidatus Limnocylindria bacterium]
MASARAFGAALAPFASGVSVNVLADEGQEGVRRAYGDAKLARLATLKRQYDPENIFHLNQNIVPAPLSQRLPPRTPPARPSVR